MVERLELLSKDGKTLWLGIVVAEAATALARRCSFELALRRATITLHAAMLLLCASADDVAAKERLDPRRSCRFLSGSFELSSLYCHAVLHRATSFKGSFWSRDSGAKMVSLSLSFSSCRCSAVITTMHVLPLVRPAKQIDCSCCTDPTMAVAAATAIAISKAMSKLIAC